VSVFDRLFDVGSAIPLYQPIVSLADGRLVGFEVLARSCIQGLENPKEMFLIAGRLQQAESLSRLFRTIGVRSAAEISGVPNLFLNTHPLELEASDLLPSLTELRAQAPHQPLTLEIHESAVTDPVSMNELRARLRDLDIGLAYDDFGSGHDRLMDLIEVPPDVLKFDARFVRDIQKAPPARRAVVSTLVKMVRELGVAPLAECVETLEESETCLELGFEYGQGYLYGRPGRIGDGDGQTVAARRS